MTPLAQEWIDAVAAAGIAVPAQGIGNMLSKLGGPAEGTSRRSCCIAAFAPRRIPPTERREVDDPGVEPRVADLGDPLHLAVALLAADDDAVDPRAVQLFELLKAVDGPPVDEVVGERDLVEEVMEVDEDDRAVDILARDAPVAHRCCRATRPPSASARRSATRRTRAHSRPGAAPRASSA